MVKLITGVAGFIGSHTCESLLEQNDEIVGIDNFDPYYNRKLKEKNIEKIKNKPNFHFEKCDIRNEEKIKKIFNNHNIQKIIHLAARAGVRQSVKNPRPYEEINILGTINLLELAKEKNVKSFIFGSSSSVYGETNEIPFKENGPKNPISPYATSKLSAEKFCKTYHRLHDLNVTILRFFTVYGPRQRPEMAIHKFTRLIDKGEKIPVYGDGSSKRDYTYVDDIVAGINKALEKDHDCEVFNLGNNKTVKLEKLISIIEEKLGKKAEIDRKPMPKGDVPITYADITKAKKLLDYNPKTPIEKGIEKFIEWYKRNKTILKNI